MVLKFGSPHDLARLVHALSRYNFLNILCRSRLYTTHGGAREYLLLTLTICIFLTLEVVLLLMLYLVVFQRHPPETSERVTRWSEKPAARIGKLAH